MAGEVTFLSPEWVAALPDAFRDLPRRADVTLTVEHTVTGGPDGPVTYWVAYEEGRPVATGLGPAADAAVTMTAPHAVAVEVAQGQVDASTTFMQGRTKVGGDQAALLRLLAVTATPEHRAATGRLAARTGV
jgi:predicted lipid carrier protein YhbT